jgi:hypothetical protein
VRLFRRRAAVVPVAAALILLASSCSSSGGGITIAPAARTPSATATSGASTTPAPTRVPTSAASATPTPTPAPTLAAPTGTPGGAGATGTPQPQAGDLRGTPFSTADVRAAVNAAGRVFFVDTDRKPLCPNTTVREVTFWAASAGGTDYGPNWALWVYPDADALAADWDVSSGKVRPRTPCDLPTGWTYWNSNLVLTFVTWSGVGGDVPFDPLRSPGDDAVPAAFLAMSP